MGDEPTTVADTTKADETTIIAATDTPTNEADATTAADDAATDAAATEADEPATDGDTNEATTKADETEATTEVDTTPTVADTTPTVADTTTNAPTEPPVKCKPNSCADPNSECTVEDDEITCPCKDGYETNANGACICNTRLRPMEFLCDTGTDTADQDYFDGEESSAKTVESTLVSMLAAIFLLCFMN